MNATKTHPRVISFATTASLGTCVLVVKDFVLHEITEAVLVGRIESTETLKYTLYFKATPSKLNSYVPEQTHCYLIIMIVFVPSYGAAGMVLHLVRN